MSINEKSGQGYQMSRRSFVKTLPAAVYLTSSLFTACGGQETPAAKAAFAAEKEFIRYLEDEEGDDFAKAYRAAAADGRISVSPSIAVRNKDGDPSPASAVYIYRDNAPLARIYSSGRDTEVQVNESEKLKFKGSEKVKEFGKDEDKSEPSLWQRIRYFGRESQRPDQKRRSENRSGKAYVADFGFDPAEIDRKVLDYVRRPDDSKKWYEAVLDVVGRVDADRFLSAYRADRASLGILQVPARDEKTLIVDIVRDPFTSIGYVKMKEDRPGPFQPYAVNFNLYARRLPEERRPDETRQDEAQAEKKEGKESKDIATNPVLDIATGVARFLKRVRLDKIF